MADNSDKPTSSTPTSGPKDPPAKPKPPVVSSKIASADTAGSAAKTDRGNKTTSPKAQANGKTAKTGFMWLVVVLNFILLVLVLAAAYWGYLQWQQLQTTQTQYLQNQQNKLDQQAKSNLALTGDIEQQNRSLAGEIKQYAEQLQNVARQAQQTAAQSAANQQTIAAVAGRRPADWLLAEADFLIRMAGRKLWLEHDVKTAMLMLQSADSRLQDLDDPSLVPIRERLAQDLQGLQQINPVSLSSVALSLGALLQQVDTLPLITFERPEKTEEDAQVSGSVDNWRSNLARNWKSFTQDFFSFRKKETDIKPYLSEQQQWLAKEQLKLTLLQAQGAVMKEDVTLYQQALQNALAVLIEDFDTQASVVSQFTNAVQNLIETDIERVYPGQFSVAPALDDLIQQRLDDVFSNGNATP